MNHIYRVQFPALVSRFEACRTKLGISKDEVYGCFFNFCLNMARPSTGLKRVHCKPHVDFKNVSIGVSVLFVYGEHSKPSLHYRVCLNSKKQRMFQQQ